MTLFTVKYAPENLDQVFGQQKAVEALKDFVVNYKTKKQKAALLYGPIGNGKTCSVYALTKELDYEILEINSSNLRNQEAMKTFLNSALGQQSLFFKPKLILIDEIDNLSGVKDRGAIQALTKAIEKSSFPVILTANDPFNSKLKTLKKVSQMIEFHKLQYRTVSHALQWVAQQEGIEYEEKAINSLARQVDGDLRGALIDLQANAIDKKFSFADLEGISDRKRTESIMSALSIIFKSSSVDNALPALNDVDLKMNEIMLWLDENLPKEYLDPSSLARAYEHFSRADVFSGRIRRQQHWRFLVYINNLLTAGISSAKDKKNSTFIPYKQTMRLLKIWQAKMRLAKKKEIARKLSVVTHTSKKVAINQIPYFQQIFRNSDSSQLIKELDLNEEEVSWLKK